MKHLLKFILPLAVVAVITSCNRDEEDTPPAVDPNAFRTEESTRRKPGGGDTINETIVNVYGTLTGAATFEATKKYKLNGYVRIGSGGVLTIQPGTIIVGDFATKGTLVVQQGGRLIADGTASAPIVFTSDAAPGQRTPGQWGGVVICGNAPNNLGTNVVLEGDYGGVHGGNNATDNSGILRYVRIEFGGVALFPNQEINGLTLASVGSGTVIENVQVSYNGDDAFEWFGGTVNCKNLISLGNTDDDMDADNGYTGMVQYGVVLRLGAIADQSGSNGFEMDNDAQGSNNTPRTTAKFANFTVVGPQATGSSIYNPNFARALHMRRNSAVSVFNSVFVGFPRGLNIDGVGTQTAANTGTLKFEGNILSIIDSATTLQLTTPSGTTPALADINAWFTNTGVANIAYNGGHSVLLGGGSYPVAPTGSGATSTMPSGLAFSASITGSGGVTLPGGFEANTFRGAFGPNNATWANGWAEWNPNRRLY